MDVKKQIRTLLPGIIVILCGCLGVWLVRDAFVRSTPTKASGEIPSRPRQAPTPPRSRPMKAGERDRFADGTTVEVFASAWDGEIILRFPSDESYDNFLHALDGGDVRLLARLDRLRAVRIGYDDPDALDQLLARENLGTYSSLTRFPVMPKPGGGAGADALDVGARILPAIGITRPDPRWGQGVKVAVIDSGILPHPALPSVSRSIEIVPFPDDRDSAHGHGTAVASLIAGRHELVSGPAPGVELISVRVIDESGRSDAFAIAAGLLAAMDAGAELVNLSLGSDGDAPLMGAAIKMVLDAGIIVVASSGNEGAAEARFPASYAGVLSVGAVDAAARRSSFSNLGSWLSLTAPGHGVNAAWTGGKFVKVNGTSASAPLVTGAIAATMSDGSGRRLDARRAAEIVLSHTDDAGPPGPDAEFGQGILNLGRVINRDLPGIQDAAIFHQNLVPSSTGGTELEISIQNRGTAPLVNMGVDVTSNSGTRRINLTSLAPGAVTTLRVPIHVAPTATDDAVEVTTRLVPSGIWNDLTPSNNALTGRFRPLQR